MARLSHGMGELPGSGWTFNNEALPMLLGNREDICNPLWIPCGLGTECFMAMQLSRGCTRDCQLGRMCVRDVDVRRESGTEEGGWWEHMQSPDKRVVDLTPQEFILGPEVTERLVTSGVQHPKHCLN